MPSTEHWSTQSNLQDALELEGCVELAGGCSDVRERLREANVGVLTSDTEGLPVSILEYMAESLPVVMTDVGQAPHLLKESQVGIVVPPVFGSSLASFIVSRTAVPPCL